MHLQRTSTPVIGLREESGHVAECLGLPVVTLATLDDVAANLREAVSLQLSGEYPGAWGLAAVPNQPG